MTLFWCALALLQATFLPGYLATRWLRLDEGFVKTWVASFGISLLVNYHLVLFLTLAKLTTRTSVCAVISAEVLALAWTLRGPRRAAAGPAKESRLTRFLIPNGVSGDVSGARLLLLFAGVSPLVYFATFVPEAFSTAFVNYDALVSINRWALDWSQGLLPAWTMHYPQLLPAVWSLTYTLIGGEFQFVPKGLSLLFPATSVLMLVDLGLRRNRGEYMLAAAFTGVLVSHSDAYSVASGFLDLPVACLALAPFYLLACCESGAGVAWVRRHVVAATACVTACALTKQAGMYAATVFPVLLAFDLRERSRESAGIDVPRTLAVVVALLLLLIVPWHVYKEIQIQQGLETWEQAASAGVHGGRTFTERLAWAWKLWELELTLPLAFATTLAIGLSLAAKDFRALSLSITLPFTLIWVFFFSYDRRNLSLAFPFLGISAGAGAFVARDLLAQRWERLGPIGRRILGVGLLAVVLAGTLYGVGERPADAHDRALRKLGSAELNAFLYEYADKHGFEGKVLTNYRLMSALPGLRDHVYFDRAAVAGDFWPFRDPVAFGRVLKKRRSVIRYVVVLRPADLRIMDFLKRGIDAGKLQVLYRTRVGLVVRIPRAP
jgi:hypothetical protein